MSSDYNEDTEYLAKARLNCIFETRFLPRIIRYMLVNHDL